MIQIEYDKEADAMYIRIRKGKFDISGELAENVKIDLDKTGQILGIEVLCLKKLRLRLRNKNC
jgi:uncharacterized protein YuzE